MSEHTANLAVGPRLEHVVDHFRLDGDVLITSQWGNNGSLVERSRWEHPLHQRVVE